MNLIEINKRIKKEICYETIDKLKDENLLNDYLKSKSVNNQISKLKSILNKYLEKEKCDKIINEYLINLIPPGTKGSIRGNKFNLIVKDKIENMKLDNKKFEVCFEKECKICPTQEKPDWYIMEKKSNKVLIGMNQISLFNGGQQLNRGSKYIIDNPINTNKSKLLCVICNEINLKNEKSKVYKLFEIGYKNNTLTYLNNLENIINLYFK